MRTRSIHTYKRFWAAPEERYAVEITLYVSQEELDQIRKKVSEGIGI